MVIHALIVIGKVHHAREQIFKAQQGAHFFIKRMLVADHVDILKYAVSGKLVANDILNNLASSMGVLHVRVALMQDRHLLSQIIQAVIVVYNIVSELQSFAARCLLRDDCAYLRSGHPAASGDARNLGILIAIHHQHAPDQLQERETFRQQRHDDDDVGLALHLLQLRLGLFEYQGMQDQFQLLLGSRIRKDQPAHFCAIQCAVIHDVIFAKGRSDRSDGRAAALCQTVGNHICVDDARTMFSKQVGYRAFAAAYSTRESNAEPALSTVEEGHG
jgi:hypothetical protein